MKMSLAGQVELAGHEGICLTKYKDSVGVWTIGIGATRSEIPDLASWPKNKKITIQEAFNLFQRSLVKYENALNKYIKKEIPQHQFDALCSWCYNVGTGWVRKATVIRYINEGRSGQSLYDALMMYRKPPEIIGRRRKEAKLLRDGVYSNGGKALLFPVSSRGYPIYGKGKSINVWEYLEKPNPVEPEPEHVSKPEEKKLETKPKFKDVLIGLIRKYL